ncbi:hypothetical protein ACVWYN_000083 [Pedobacter sp. UYP24]
MKIFSSKQHYFSLAVSSAYVFFNIGIIRRFYRRAGKIFAVNNRKQQELPPVPKITFDIALVIYQGDCTIAYNSDNQPVPWVYSSMKATSAALATETFFMIRREIIVRGDLIEKVTKQGKEFSILLKAPFSCSYVVAKKRMAAFRAYGASNSMPWWNAQRNRFR